EGSHFAGAREVVSTIAGLKACWVGKPTRGQAEVEVTIPPGTAAAAYQFAVKTDGGQSENLPFTVDWFTAVKKLDGHYSPGTAQVVPLPVTLVGALARAGDVDYYRFDAAAGQEIGVQALTAARFEPVLQWLDVQGRMLSESSNGLLGYRCSKSGA